MDEPLDIPEHNVRALEPIDIFGASKPVGG